MSWIRSATGRSVMGILAAFGVLFAAVFAIRFGGYHLPAGARLGIALAVTVPAVWFTLAYWRSLDEAAREAQKWAWFWGGSGGLAVGLLAISFQSHVIAGFLPPDPSPERLMVAGASTVALAQLVAFFLAWAIWWWRRR